VAKTARVEGHVGQEARGFVRGDLVLERLMQIDRIEVALAQ